MIKVGIIGSTGYAGAEIVRLIQAHPEAKVGLPTKDVLMCSERERKILPEKALIPWAESS